MSFVTFLTEYPFILAFIIGLVPAMVWMWFWLKEDIHPEPAKMLTLSFFGGMLAVLFAIPLQKAVRGFFPEDTYLLYIIWAGIEEVLKFGFVYFIALRNKVTDEPVDDIIYLIISAIGFVTLENALFLVGPVGTGNFIDTIINGNLRFVGASLLHIMASATIGIGMGLSFYKSKDRKILAIVCGVIIATALHTAFNLFIISQAPGDIFFVFGAVWVGIIILLLLFERVKHIINNQNQKLIN